MRYSGNNCGTLVKKPDAFVTRIFKAQYLNDCHILRANKGTDASFVWTGLWEAKQQLCEGFRWLLGDGQDIKLFQDPWLRGKSDFRVEDHQLNVTRLDKIYDYFRPNTKEWDVHKVEQNCHANDFHLIL